MIITAAKKLERINDVPASVVVIKREDIERYGYKTLSEVLENIPGLYNLDEYFSRTNLGVRGFWSGEGSPNLIVLINGVNQIKGDNDQNPLGDTHVPVEAIDRIEIVRGPMSVIYGSGAFYGVINIITNQISESSPGAIASVSYGTSNTKRLFVRKSGREGNFHFTFNGSIYKTDGLDQPYKEMVSQPASLLFYGISKNHRTGGRLQEEQKYFQFSGASKDFTIEFIYVDSNRESIIPFPSLDQGNHYEYQQMRIAFGYQNKISDTFSLNGKLTYSTDNTHTKYDLFTEDSYGVDHYSSDFYELELNAFLNPHRDLEIALGAYSRNLLDIAINNDLPLVPQLTNNYAQLSEDNDVTTQAVYAQFTYHPLEKFSLIGGFRLEQQLRYKLEVSSGNATPNFLKTEDTYNKEDPEIVPRLAALYSFNSRNILKFLYGKAIKHASFGNNTEQLFNLLTDDLSNEYITTTEINYISQLSSTITGSVSVFHNLLDDLIVRVVKSSTNAEDPNNRFSSFRDNKGKLITNGIEFSLNVKPMFGMGAEISGTLQETEDKKNSELEVAYSPKRLGYFKAFYLMNDDWTVSLTGTYVDEMEPAWDETVTNSDSSFGNRIGKKIDGYSVFGANARLENLFSKGTYLNLRVSNLGDTEIRYPTYTANSWATEGYIGPGREVLLTIGKQFN